MATHRRIDRICCIILAAVLVLTVIFCNAEALGVQSLDRTMGYEEKLFDTSYVHTINIVMDDWDDFISTCEDEEYTACSVVIDNEAYKNVGIRAKGNTSLSSVAAYGNDRYSFKIEFDKYESGKSYYGLDKLSLNNIIQDNTYMKDYLTYRMMGYFGVAAPLCSYVYITVNGEDWGLYLAVEGVEEGFLQRNYGSDYGELYKPDSTDLGGGRGNGGDFNPDDLEENMDGVLSDSAEEGNAAGGMQGAPGDGFEGDMQFGNINQEGTPHDGDMFQGGGGFPDDDMSGFGGGNGFPEIDADGNDAQGVPAFGEDARENMQEGRQDNMMGGSVGSDDVSLIYSDDSFDSYSNIFDNAKTDITDADKARLIEALRNINNQENIEDSVDVDAVIRYFVVHNFVCNFDSYTGSMIHNYYLYEEDGKLSMIPWDYNLAFGGFSMGQGAGDGATSLVNYPIDNPVSGGTVDSRPMLAWIFSDEEYTELYHQYFAEFIEEYFDSGYFEKMIDDTIEMISPYVEKDPTKFCTYEEFETGAAVLKEFCLLRAESISGQLDGTIPSDSEGQSADSSTLVDAGTISISDMGSMGNGMGGDMGNNAFAKERDEETENAFAEQNGDGISDSQSLEGKEHGGGRTDMQRGEDQIPEMGQTDMQNTDNKNGLLLLGASGILLIAGLIFAIKYKR